MKTCYYIYYIIVNYLFKVQYSVMSHSLNVYIMLVNAK